MLLFPHLLVDNMAILVCGGAGYIGSHCVKALVDRGYETIVIDNLSTGHAQAVVQGAKLYVGDVRDSVFMNRVFSSNTIDAVVHFCAKSLVGESMQMPTDYFDNNVGGTLSLLQMMIKYQIKKIVFSSSAAVYGDHQHMPIDETYDTTPTNPYGETKLMMEKMMKWADLAHGIKYVSLRYFNVAGADPSGNLGEDHKPETHLIPIILQVALGKRPYISLYGNDYDTPDGTCIRDYIHVVDLIDAHMRALDFLSLENRSEIFNLGSENGFSVLEVIQATERVTQCQIPIQIAHRRLGDPARLIASSKKINHLLGWKPHFGIDDIIKNAYEFHRTHLNGYND